MEDGKKAKIILLIVQSIVAIIACCIIIILFLYRSDSTYLYFLIPIFIFNAITAIVYFADYIKKVRG